MAFKFSTGFRNGVLSSNSARGLLNNGKIHIYADTAPPATADDTLGTATLLVTISDTGGAGGLTFEAAVADGVLTKTTAQVWTGTVAATGTALFFRFVKDTDSGIYSTTDVRIQGLVGISGFDMNLQSKSLVETEAQPIDNFAIVFPSV